MMIHVLSFIFLLLTFVSSYAFPIRIDYNGRERVSLIKTLETRNCFISYVMIKGKVYLLKQKKDSKKQLYVVRDALAAYIAECLNIANNVDIVPAYYSFPGKVDPLSPATLHTLAQGETVRAQLDSKYNALRLRQFWARAENFDEKGLTRAIISYMTWHKQLPIIVALDLLIGNSDRHCGNLCYDPKTDTFCAIDMDDTFNKDLCVIAYEKLKMMLEDGQVIFTRKELKALQIMRKTLQYLVKKHKPKAVIEKLHMLAAQAGFVKGREIYTRSVEKKLKLYKSMILESYHSAYHLIALIDTIIKHKSSIAIND